MSPCEQDTGSTAVSRHNRQEAKGRYWSFDSRADEVLQAALARARSYEVKTALLVFLLPAWSVWVIPHTSNDEGKAYCETLCPVWLYLNLTDT